MPNNVRITAGVKDNASGPLDRLRDKGEKLRKQGLKGFGIGVGAAATTAGINLVSNALSEMGDVIGTSIEAASSLNESMSKNEAVFTRNAAKIEEWASKSSTAFGQSKRSALEAAGTYGNLFQAFGIGEDKAAKMSMRLVELASDLASFNNTSVDDALLALRSGLSGETEPLKRFGVAINDARLKEEALRLGLIKTTKGVLPQSIKTQAAYALILRDTSKAQGDFERTSDGMANQMKITAAQAEDTAAKFGEVLLPIVVEFQRTVIRALDRTGISYEDLARAAARGSQAAQAHLNALGGEAYRTARRTEYMRDAVKDDYNDIGEAAGDMAGEVGDAAGEVEDAFGDMVDAMTEDAQRAVDDFFDPLETRARIYQSRMEQNAAEERLRDAETAREKRSAADDIIEAISDQADSLIDLGDQGKLTKQDIDRFETDVKQSYTALGKKVPAELQKIINKLRELARIESSGIDIVVKQPGTHAGGSGPLEFDEGGTVPGPKGKPVPAVVHGGEFVMTAAEVDAAKEGKVGGVHYHLTVMGNLTAPNEAAVLQTMRRLQAVSKTGAHDG